MRTSFRIIFLRIVISEQDCHDLLGILYTSISSSTVLEIVELSLVCFGNILLIMDVIQVDVVYVFFFVQLKFDRGSGR